MFVIELQKISYIALPESTIIFIRAAENTLFDDR